MRGKRRGSVSAAFLLCLFLAWPCVRAYDPQISRICAQGAYETTARLSSPEFQGRLTGTEGFEKAAEWMAGEARRAGLEPGMGPAGFLQRFPVKRVTMVSASMAVAGGDAKEPSRELALFKDYMPILTSPAGEADAEAVFVGFGITAPELGRDDYAGLDVTGKVVFFLRGEPKDGRDWGVHNSSRARWLNASKHGAAAALLADQPVASPNGDPLPGLLMGEISQDLAGELMAGKGLKVEEMRRVLEAGGLCGFATGRRLRFTVKAAAPVEAEGANVLALLPGSDPAMKREYVVVGAHLDHCGNWPSLLPGADDNASGSAAVLEVARAAARLRPRPKRSILFVWFGGEEMGLLGSRFLADHPPEGFSKCAGVFNLDMVGAGDGAYVAGGKNFPALMAALESSRDRFVPGFRLTAGLSRGEPRADHGPFQQAGIPAVSLFGMGGTHHGYHTPGDTIYFITPKTIEASARVVLGAAQQVADWPGE